MLVGDNRAKLPVKQDQITATKAPHPSSCDRHLNNRSSDTNVFGTVKRLFTNCFQSSSAVVIDYSSNCTKSATSILTPSIRGKKRPRKSIAKATDIEMMMNGHAYAGHTPPHHERVRKQTVESMTHPNRCESPRITRRKTFLPSIVKDSTSAAAPMPCYDNFPSVCGKYSLEESLQNGYSGKVFKGHYLRGNGMLPVVVKCCKKLSSWNTETRALHSLDHPNIIKMVGRPEANVPATAHTSSVGSSGRGQDENKQRNRHLTPDSSPLRMHENLPLIHVLAQELATNGDLYELLQGHGPFDEVVARSIIKPIVEGLLYAYEAKGISHRDIKLENIFIAEDGTIKIGDWGLSGFETKNRLCSSSCGTLGYMAPEMVCREKYDANKTDVWALAVVLFSLCTGVRPYSEPKSRRKGPNDYSWRDEWLGAMMAGKWKLWWMSHARTTPLVKNMSPALCDLFERMFNGDMNERASLSEVLAHEWMNGPTCSNQEIICLSRRNRAGSK